LSEQYPHIELQPDGENKVFETPWIDFYYDDIVHADGKKGNYAWIKRHFDHGAMMVIPVTPSEKYLVIRIYRHPMKRYFWEFPAGLGEAGESPLDTARRELVEETGIAPTRVELLGQDSVVSGIFGESSAVVLAEIPEVTVEDLELQSDEGIVEARLLTRRELIDLFTSQEVGDGITLSCLARYWMWREQKMNEKQEKQ
jgi:8-oxo-dGTP pyrophosphatase MutT (NUDIX family)